MERDRRKDDPAPLRADEVLVLRQMMSEYQQSQAVGRWLGSKWRGVLAVAGLASGCAVLTASVIEIAKTIHG